MEDLIKILAQLLQNSGIKSIVILVMAILILLSSILTYRWLSKYIDHYQFKQTITHNQKDLYNHSIFQTIRRCVTYDIHYLVIGERLREAIFRDLLIFVFSGTAYELTDFLDRGDLEKMDDKVYKNKIQETFNSILKNYEERAKQEAMPEIVLNKFNEWHSARITMTYDFINDICDSEDFFDSNIVKTKIIFDFFVHLMNLTIVDARRTLINLNGDLSKLTYKGITSERI